MGADLNTDLKATGSRQAPRASVAAYGPLATLFYDADKPFAAKEELAWYGARLPRDAGAILEAMAGSGRVLVPLTGEGFRVHGVDISEAMLASCAARLRSAGHEARLFRQNITALNVPFRYGAAFIAAGSLQLLTAQDAVLEALARIRAHLVAPALLLLDLFVPDAALHPPGAPVVEFGSAILPDGSQIVRRSESTCDPEHRRLYVASRYERRAAGQIVARDDELVTSTWYKEDEILSMLRHVGYSEARIEPPPCAPAEGLRFGVSAMA
jgi:SAM-dependent methyltransferase